MCVCVCVCVCVCRTAPLTSRCCILYIYSTNTRTEYFKHAAHSPLFFSSKCRLFHNATFFGSFVIHILYTGCAKIKKKSGAKGLIFSSRYAPAGQSKASVVPRVLYNQHKEPRYQIE